MSDLFTEKEQIESLPVLVQKDANLSRVYFFLKSTLKPPEVHQEFCSTCLAKTSAGHLTFPVGMCVMTKRDMEVDGKGTERGCFFISISLQSQ